MLTSLGAFATIYTNKFKKYAFNRIYHIFCNVKWQIITVILITLWERFSFHQSIYEFPCVIYVLKEITLVSNKIICFVQMNSLDLMTTYSVTAFVCRILFISCVRKDTFILILISSTTNTDRNNLSYDFFLYISLRTSWCI